MMFPLGRHMMYPLGRHMMYPLGRHMMFSLGRHVTFSLGRHDVLCRTSYNVLSRTSYDVPSRTSYDVRGKVFPHVCRASYDLLLSVRTRHAFSMWTCVLKRDHFWLGQVVFQFQTSWVGVAAAVQIL